MAGRVRPSGSVNVPTESEIDQARVAVAESLRDLSAAVDTVILRLNRITSPVERAKAAMEVRRFISGSLSSATDTLFRDAVIEAYARGRAEHGWYGYGALAEELDISRARVQQIVNGSWKKPEQKNTALVEEIRASADRVRTVRRLAAAGRTVDEIAEATGLSIPAINDMLS